MPQEKERPITRFDIPHEKGNAKKSCEQQPTRNAQAIHPTSTRTTPEHERCFRGNNPPVPSKKRKGPPHDLTLPGIVESGKGPGPILRNESPWKTLKKIYGCDLADEVMVVVKKSKPKNLYLLKRFSGDGLDEIFHKLSSIQHINVAFAKHCFATTDGLFTLSDFVPLTLGHIVACRHYPDVEQLNAIMTQVNFIPALIGFGFNY